jgi:hypothetical protein
MNEGNSIVEATASMLSQTIPDEITEKIKEYHKTISDIKTPKRYIGKKGKYKYIKRHYMKMQANKLFPGWSFTIQKYDVLAKDFVLVHGRLIWTEFGIRRVGDMISGHAIAKSAGASEFVGLDNDIKAACTDTWKKACNWYMNIGDDVYKMNDEELNDKDKKLFLDLIIEIGDEYLETVEKHYVYDDFVKMIEDKEINVDNASTFYKWAKYELKQKEKAELQAKIDDNKPDAERVKAE